MIQTNLRICSSLYLLRIVGDDDGGKLFTPEEYEAYKKRVLPMVCFKHSCTSFQCCAGLLNNTFTFVGEM